MTLQTRSTASTAFLLMLVAHGFTAASDNFIATCTVTEATSGGPIVGASVTVTPPGYTARTNEQGVCFIQGLQRQWSTFRVQATGYQERTEQVLIDKNMGLNFALLWTPEDVYVANEGDDTLGDGREDNPWQTIRYAMTWAADLWEEYSRPVVIHLAAGVYNEKVLFTPHVSIVGAAADTTTIQYYEPNDIDEFVVAASDQTRIERCTITLPDGARVHDYCLLTITNVEMEVSEVVLWGKDNDDITAVDARGIDSSGSVVRDTIVKDVAVGVRAVNSGITVTRTLFQDILERALLVRRPPAGVKQSVSPVLGRADDIENTSLNRFRGVISRYVTNLGSLKVEAELNDWGTYATDDIQRGMEGTVDFEPFFTKSLPASAVLVRLLDETTRSPIPSDASPSVTLTVSSGGSIRAEWYEDEGLFIAPNLAEGRYTVVGRASGYISNREAVTYRSGENIALDIELEEGVSEPSCGSATSKSRSILHDGRPGDLITVVLVVVALASTGRRRYPRSSGRYPLPVSSRTDLS